MPVVKVQGIYLATCTRCKQTWAATKPNPTKCAKCRNKYWNKPKRKKRFLKGKDVFKLIENLAKVYDKERKKK